MANVKHHVASISDFITSWNAAKSSVSFHGRTVSLHIDGYDVDHEGSTWKRSTKDVLQLLRAKMGKDFIIGITPCTAIPEAFLDPSMVDSCDFINMQRYSGGLGTDALVYKQALGVEVIGKLTYGLEIENPHLNDHQNNSIQGIKQIFTLEGNPYQAIWTRRLGSGYGLLDFQNLMQVWLSNWVHKRPQEKALRIKGVIPDDDLVTREWQKRINGPH